MCEICDLRVFSPTFLMWKKWLQKNISLKDMQTNKQVLTNIKTEIKKNKVVKGFQFKFLEFKKSSSYMFRNFIYFLFTTYFLLFHHTVYQWCTMQTKNGELMLLTSNKQNKTKLTEQTESGVRFIISLQHFFSTTKNLILEY